MNDRTTPSPLVLIVVLNWNCWRQTLGCLASLDELDYPNRRILVVDNGSTDSSEPHIREARPEVGIIQTGANLGYAGGNNVGIRYALDFGAPYVLVMNPDVELERRALTKLVRAAECHPRIGALSPVIRWKTKPDRVWFGGSRIQWWRARALHEYAAPASGSLHPSAWASGCCLFLSAECLKRVGVFEERLFLYWEEADLCQRILAEGYLVGVCPDADAFHDVSSVVGLDSSKGWYYFTRNALYFFRRHAPRHGVPPAWAGGLALIRFSVLGPLWAILSRDGTARARLAACRDFLSGDLGPSTRYL